MLITNTPNNELHIFNNEGEEIVSINDSGVTKPETGGSAGYKIDVVTLAQEQTASRYNRATVKATSATAYLIETTPEWRTLAEKWSNEPENVTTYLSFPIFLYVSLEDDSSFVSFSTAVSDGVGGCYLRNDTYGVQISFGVEQTLVEVTWDNGPDTLNVKMEEHIYEISDDLWEIFSYMTGKM